MIEQREQRRRGIATQRFGEFKIAPGGGVHAHPLAGLLYGERAQVRNRCALRGFHVIEQGVSSTNGDRHLLSAEAAQIVGAELRAQIAPRCVEIKMPRRNAAQRNFPALIQCLLKILRYKNFRRAQAFKLRIEIAPCRFKHRKAPRRQRQPRNAQRIAHTVQCQQNIVALVVEQRCIGQCAGCNHAHHLALDRPFRRGRITDLLANRHRFAELNQLGQILLHRVIRYARHFDRHTR